MCSPVLSALACSPISAPMWFESKAASIRIIPGHRLSSATDGRHASYLNTNRSKRSIAIDLKNETGQKIAARLAAVSDVVIENFSAGVMDRLNLDYETLQRDQSAADLRQHVRLRP